jgi:replicative DNA helicase
MELYLAILKLFVKDQELRRKYFGSVDLEWIRKHFPEVYRIYAVLEQEQGALSRADLEALLYKNYTNSDKELYDGLFNRIESMDADPNKLVEYLHSCRVKTEAGKAAFALLDYAEGKSTDLVKVYQSSQDFLTTRDEVLSEEEDEFVSFDLDKLEKEVFSEGGLKWRLTSLNRSLGPLRKGNMGFIFARPETGKTTFLASEITFMAEQTDRPIIWFNNEQPGNEVAYRLYSSCLGVSVANVRQHKERAQKAFYERTRGNILLKDKGHITRVDVERIVRKTNPSLIIFDQLDKIQGFNADRDDLHLGAIYQWARELAKDYAPVIGVSQADGSAGGIKYLNMEHVANAKTAKQAEADWILGIGYTYGDSPNVRGFSICKNKLLGGDQTVAALRHGKWETLIDGDIGRYIDIKE